MSVLTRWRRWRSPYCNAWDPAEGAGRDTHICLRDDKRHAGPHKCKCGAAWDRVTSPGVGREARDA